MHRKYGTNTISGNRKPVFIDGIRTPFVKSFGAFAEADSLELFSRVVDALVRKLEIDPNELDEVIAGEVAPQSQNPNVARDAIINLGLPHHIHGYTLNRACTSSIQTIADAAKEIAFGHPNLILAGGVECLSNVPIAYSKEARKFLVKLNKSRSAADRLAVMRSFSPSAWIPKPPAIAEPLTGLSMGEHTEIMAKINKISRRAQDEFALESHRKACQAQESGKLTDELCPVWPLSKGKSCVDADNLIRKDATLESLSNLRPAFDHEFGTLTAGNSSPLTDGAAIALIADEERAKSLGLKPKSRIVDFAFVGVDPMDQLLIGPAIAIPLLLKRNNLKISDIDLFEIHEAFAAQVLSCQASLESREFTEKYFGESKPFGSIPFDRMNVNGGAIAIGHPFGATGARLVTSLSLELIRSNKNLGVIGVCAAGGMAAAMLIERVG